MKLSKYNIETRHILWNKFSGAKYLYLTWKKFFFWKIGNHGLIISERNPDSLILRKYGFFFPLFTTFFIFNIIKQRLINIPINRQIRKKVGHISYQKSKHVSTSFCEHYVKILKHRSNWTHGSIWVYIHIPAWHTSGVERGHVFGYEVSQPRRVFIWSRFDQIFFVCLFWKNDLNFTTHIN